MNARARPDRRIGLFGGSFDPVHTAHLTLAHSALHDLALDELRWIPAGRPWQKSRQLAEPQHRAAMIELAIRDPQLGDPLFNIETCELDRDGPSYTVDTVLELQRREPGQTWFLIIGQDQHAGLHTWHRWSDLLRKVSLAVAMRPGASLHVDPRVLDFGFIRLKMPPDELSSTLLRDRLAAGRPITDLVPAAVAGYIESHRLYRNDES